MTNPDWPDVPRNGAGYGAGPPSDGPADAGYGVVSPLDGPGDAGYGVVP
jgi:hypothetical protein